MRRIIGIDPGSAETTFAVIGDNYEVLDAGKILNHDMRAMLRNPPAGQHFVAIEGIQAYGMAVGREVFDTCYQIGMLMECCEHAGLPFIVYNRPEYTRAICGVGKVNDAVLRQALLLRFGGDKKGEPLFLLKGNSDKRSAFAIAAYHLDRTRKP